MSAPPLAPLLGAAAGRRDASPPPDRAVLEAAAGWYVQLKGEPPQTFDHAGLERWIAANDAHRRAWELVQQLDRHLAGVPAGLARPALQGAQRQRRAALKVVALLATAGTGGWLAHAMSPWQADHVTAPGERRTVALADGGTLELDTDTAVDVRYDAGRRLLRLHWGAIMVRTGADARTPSRPFVVETPQGRIRALGTRFGVRSAADGTRVAVFEHAVEVSPAAAPRPAVRIDAGRQATFTGRAVGALAPLERGQDAWTLGMLVAVDQRMDAFLAELARYRRGHLACAQDVAAMRVTGAYRLDDIDAVLASLTASHPVRVRHFTRWWVQVEAAG